MLSLQEASTIIVVDIILATGRLGQVLCFLLWGVFSISGYDGSPAEVCEPGPKPTGGSVVALREKTPQQHPHSVVSTCLEKPPETLSGAMCWSVFSCSKAKSGVGSCWEITQDVSPWQRRPQYITGPS